LRKAALLLDDDIHLKSGHKKNLCEMAARRTTGWQ
jgi:hypothetical protein